MGMKNTAFLLLGLLSASMVYLIFPHWIRDPSPPVIKSFEWWGKGAPPVGAESAPIVSKPFKIHVKENEIQDLKRRIKAARYTEPLENSHFTYGFPGSELKKVADYWLNQYNWTEQEAKLNQFHHFKANIEGIDLHYLRVAPKVQKNITVIPLLLLHGWPSSFLEFTKVIPIFATPNQNFVFDIVCSSIPGYGYSEAPHKIGFNTIPAARIFVKLMASLKFDNFYVQGTDWGSVVASTMGVLYPNRVRGLHVNFIVLNPFGPRFLMNSVLGHINKDWVLDDGQTKSIFPLTTYISNIMVETGYLHIQASQPDVIGAAMCDSPIGLAGYILEKFVAGTNLEYRDLPDGGLTRKFSMDDLLTNVMIYWTTNTCTSSSRLYKEVFKSSHFFLGVEMMPVKVPVGLTVFENEALPVTESMAKDRFRDIVQFRHQPRGGHFAALEEPEVFAKDVIDFVAKNELRNGNHKKSFYCPKVDGCCPSNN